MSIRYSCVTCKKVNKITTTQLMGRLPQERLKPAPAWNCAAVDLFGPFRIRGEVQKRTTGKAYDKFHSYLVLFTYFQIHVFTVLLIFMHLFFFIVMFQPYYLNFVLYFSFPPRSAGLFCGQGSIMIRIQSVLINLNLNFIKCKCH